LSLQYWKPAKQLSATTVLAMVAAAIMAILEKYMFELEVRWFVEEEDVVVEVS
jgi:hypothetical protein